MTPTIISIDGNIGSGKSTLVKLIGKHFKERVCILKEPVDEWENIKDRSGKTIIQNFYENQKDYAFSFQMMAYISRLSSLRKLVKSNPDGIIITERSVLTDRQVFAKMLFDSGKIRDIEYSIYLKWFDEYIEDFPISHIIYLKTNPEICGERIKKRLRDGEDNVELEYLKSCHEYHDTWLENTDIPVMEISGNPDIEKTPSTIDNWMEKINEILYNK